MTVEELFLEVNLRPEGPLPWGDLPPDTCGGVYVVARNADGAGQAGHREVCFDFAAMTSCRISVDMEYERLRWLPSEPVLYVGMTNRSLRARLRQFRRHECGERSPHAGGQVIRLLKDCPQCIYFACSDDPRRDETAMLRAFRNVTGFLPFGNSDRRVRRIKTAA